MGACLGRLIGARIENAHFIIVFGLAIFLGGCNNEKPVAPPIRVVDAGPIEPAEVELSNPKVRIDDEGNFRFEVNYLFTSGKPRQHYLVTIHFPGTSNLCLKHMEAWELKQEGVIKDGIPLTGPIKTYEIIFSEADSPMNPYKLISNVLASKME